MTQPTINLSQLKKYLQERSTEQLISEISELFKKFPSVKDYYQIKVYPQDEIAINTKFKKIIEHEFFPDRGLGKAKLSVAKKAISDYKKLCQTEAGLIDLMLFYVEQGVKFTQTYGDIDENFYTSIEGVYQKAVGMIINSKLEENFQQRCLLIVENTSGLGWGFHDMLSEVYEEAFC